MLFVKHQAPFVKHKRLDGGITLHRNQKPKRVSRTLIAYYSRRGENYVGGVIKKLQQGNTECVAGKITALKPLSVNVKDYDRIIVGSPTWWYKMAPAVLTFLSENDFTGKTVVPFMTNAGWPGTVLKEMTAAAEKNGAKVEHGHEFRFSSDSKHFDLMVTPEKELEQWINTLKQ